MNDEQHRVDRFRTLPMGPGQFVAQRRYQPLK